jgi:uncharacterized protein (UPF0332 family)
MKKLKPHTIDWAQIDRFLAGADKKLASARKILAFDEEACLQQAYEAMLKASLGFMFSHGFRARSQPGHHIAIIEFVRQRIDRKHAGLLTVLDRLRRKRNQALYDDTGFVSHTTLNKPSKQPATTWRSLVRTSARENNDGCRSCAANLSKPLPNELIHALVKKPGPLSPAAGLEKRARGSSLAVGSKYFHFPATHFSLQTLN